MKRQRGFSLTELVMVMAIVAILLAIGVPSYRYIGNSYRMSSEVNGLLGDLMLARAEAIKDSGMPVPPALGSAQAINFQPTGGGKAAITGDFVLAGQEVNPVIKALRENGIEVTAVHNHMLDDEPRMFYAHFWAVDDAVKLATGLRAALDKLRLAKS